MSIELQKVNFFLNKLLISYTYYLIISFDKMTKNLKKTQR